MNSDLPGVSASEELEAPTPVAESPAPQEAEAPADPPPTNDAAPDAEASPVAELPPAEEPAASDDETSPELLSDEAVAVSEEAPSEELISEEAASPDAEIADAEPEAAIEEMPADAEVAVAEAELVEETPASDDIADAEAEPVEEVPAEAPVGEPETMAELLQQEESGVKTFRRGELLQGVVTATSPTAVMVDVGGKTEGVIPGRELERMNRQTLELLKPGAEIAVYVVNPSDHNGDLVLSLNRALEELDWEQAEAHRQNQEVYQSHVAGYNRGGLIVRFGRLRGFVPQSQVSDERRRAMGSGTPEEMWGKMVNEPIGVKVMEVDRSRNRLILSERAASRELREARKESLIQTLQVGEVRTGKIVSLEDFGAFVDIGGAEGLVHLTELSWKHVTHPRQLYSIGQEVKVEVISIDRNQKRIGLSIKRQEADPWDSVALGYNVGQLVQGNITKLTKFGAFAKLIDAPAVEGLIHISELSDQHVSHPREVVKEGDTLTLRVVKIDIENRRLGLSLKRVNSAEYLDMDWTTYASGSQEQNTSQS